MRPADTSPRPTPERPRPDACAPARPGTRLDHGRYRLDDVIGRTPSTIRYRAFDERLDRPVVFEEYAPAGAVRRGSRILVAPRLRDRFEVDRNRFDERCRAVARIARPGTVRVFGVLHEGGTSGLVTELVGGTSLRRLRADRSEPLPSWAVHDIAGRVAAALRPAHAAAVFHGALDLDTIVLTDEGRLVVTGFDLTDPGDDPGTRIRGDVAALADLLRTIGDRPIPPPPEGRARAGFDDLLADLGVPGLPRDPVSPLLGLRAGHPGAEPAVGDPGGATIARGGPEPPGPAVPDPDATLHDPPADGGLPDATTVWDPADHPTDPGDPAGRPRGRAGSIVPFVLTAAALGSAAPVLTGAILVVGVLPALSTAGDPRRRGLGRFTATRFLGHQLTGLARALPVIGLTTLLLLAHRAAVGADLDPVLADLLLRATGVVTVAGLLGVLRDRPDRSPARRGLDRMIAGLRSEGRAGERAIAAWIVLLALSVIAVWMEPTVFPIP